MYPVAVFGTYDRSNRVGPARFSVTSVHTLVLNIPNERLIGGAIVVRASLLSELRYCPSFVVEASSAAARRLSSTTLS
jgi:hypothetical protein